VLGYNVYERLRCFSTSKFKHTNYKFLDQVSDISKDSKLFISGSKTFAKTILLLIISILI
jgi:hypothetical protein